MTIQENRLKIYIYIFKVKITEKQGQAAKYF